MQTALVTGGSRGIGAQVVRTLLEDGYRVAFLYRNSHEQADKLAAETGAIALCADACDSAQVAQACERAGQQLGHIDALVCCAGIAQQKLITDVTDDDWRTMLDTNLSGAFYAIRAVLPGMVSRRYGRIVTVSSIWGQVGASCEAHYSAAKAGLIGLTKAIAKEVAPSDITANCVCPGVIDTDMIASFTEKDLAALKQETPVGRLGTPQDVASCVRWLCSHGAGFVTGQVIGVNGGFGE